MGLVSILEELFTEFFLLLQKASKLVPHYHKMIFSYKSLLLYICDVHRNLFDCLINSSISSPAMETAKFFCRFSCFKLICYCSTILLRKQKKFAFLSSQDKSLICLRAIYGKLSDRCRLRQEEVYECENCDGCPFAERCKKTDKNRKVRINRELTAMHQEVVKNLESIQGALLRTNRSIQVESTFGIRKK